MLVVRDKVGMAYMGRPFVPYLSLGVYPEQFDRLRGPDGLSRRRSRFGYFQVTPRDAESCLRVVTGDTSVFVPSCSAIVVGHT